MIDLRNAPAWMAKHLRGITGRTRRRFAFTMWITASDGRRVKIGVPVGMTVADLEDQLHERYWSPNTDEKEPKE